MHNFYKKIEKKNQKINKHILTTLMSDNKKVCDIYQIDKFDKSKFAFKNGVYSYDDSSLFTAYVDMTHMKIINDNSHNICAVVTFPKLLFKFNIFLEKLCEYIDVEPSSRCVRFHNLNNKDDNKFILVEFRIEEINGHDFCFNAISYQVIVDKTNECVINDETINIDIITYLHQEIGLTKQDFQSNNNEACKFACNNNHIDVVKYLHQEIRLSKDDFQSDNNEACRWACKHGHINVVKYLHQEIGLTKQDFQSDYNYACRWACLNGHIDVVKYLHQEIKLTKQDFRSNDNYACQLACQNGHINVVKYLHQEIELSKDDFQSDDNYACKLACENGEIDVVKYLHQEIRLTKQDFQSDDNYACEWACRNGHLGVVKYLHQDIGISNGIIINYLSNLQFDITNINKITKTYTITTNDMINKYPDLKIF